MLRPVRRPLRPRRLQPAHLSRPPFRRLGPAAWALTCFTACAPAPEPIPTRGPAPPPPKTAPSAAPRPPAPPSPASDPDGFRPVARFGEAHHAPRGGSVELLASLQAMPPYPRLGPTAVVPEGGSVAVRSFDWQAGEPGPAAPNPGARAILLMRKREPGFFPAGQDWEFFELSAKGDVLRGGRLEDCARCHAEAPHGGLFGPPRTSGGPP